MRIFFKTLLVLGLFSLSIQIYAQQNILSEKIDCAFKGQPLEKLLKYLDQEHQVKFAYATESIKDIPVKNNYSSESIDKILKDELSASNIDYKLYDEVVMLRKSNSYTEAKETEAYKKSLHIKGKITDGSSSESLVAATISIMGTLVGTYSDDEGNFDIEISSEHLDKQLVIQYLGYEDQKFSIKKLKDSYLLVPLTQGDFGIEEIIIVNRDLPIKIGGPNKSYSLSRELISSTTVGVAGADVVKNIQLLPGVSAFDDSSSDIKIRGSNSDETLIILDGIPLYNVDHFYGVFSSVNSNYVESIDIYKNNIPVNYSEKTAGVVAMFSDTSVIKDFSATADLNLLSAALNFKIPISDQASFLFSSRSSYKNVSNTSFNSFAPMREVIQTENFLVDESILNSADPSFKFRDVNAKFTWNPKAATKLMFNFFNSVDMFENEFENDNDRRSIEFETKNEEEWKNLGASINLKSTLSPSVNLTSNIYYSNYQVESSLEFLFDKSFDDNRNEEVEFGSNRENQIADLGFNLMLEKKGIKSSYAGGISASIVDVNYEFEDNDITTISNEGQASTISGFGNYTYLPTSNLSLNFAVKASYYSGTEKFYLSPRVSSSYKLSDKFSLKGAYGIYQQFIREITYENRGQIYELWVDSNNDGANQIPVIISKNSMLGFTYKNSRLSFDAEFYHKDIDGMVEFAVLNPRQSDFQSLDERDYILYNGQGISRGVDFLFGYYHNRFDTYLAYTVSKIEQSFDEIAQGDYFVAEDDRRHQLKWINQIHIGDFTINTNWIYNTGRWYTDIVAFELDERRPDRDQRSVFKRLDPYNRVDLGVNYRLSRGKLNFDIGASLFNVFNNENLKFQQTIESRFFENQRVENTFHTTETNLLARTLNLNLKLTFE